MDYAEFRRKVLKLGEKRNHKVKNSYGVYDAFKYYRKIKPKDKKYILTESQYFSIIRNINNLLIENLLHNNDIKFPSRMGSLEVRKRQTNIKIVDGKLVDNLPIDWDRTLKLWAEDEESYNNKTLIKLEEDEVFIINYNKKRAIYNNKMYYQFNVNRKLKQRLKELIKNNEIDAFELWQNNNRVLK